MTKKKTLYRDVAFERAQKIPAADWNSYVYWEGKGDEYFPSWEAIKEYCQGWNEELPHHVWGCDKLTLTAENLELHLFYAVDGDWYDTAADDLKNYHAEALTEFQTAIAHFTERLEQEGFCAYSPNYKIAIISPYEQ